jgi:hypothetical protein
MPQQTTIHVTLSLDAAKQLEEVAAQKGLSLTEVVRFALEEYLERETEPVIYKRSSLGI